jgi:tRNA(fMet)-specific endonuclease VapC
MVDTNICIYAMQGRLLPVLRKFDAHRAEISISVISRAELDYGVAKSDRRERSRAALDAFLADLQVLPFDASAADHFGQIRAHLERAGTPCGPYDLLIGAHARSLGLTLVTNNRRGFDRMPELKVENWT